MRRNWILALAAVATVAFSMPTEAGAQGRSAEARQRQAQQADARERERERDRLRAQRESEAREQAARRQREAEQIRREQQARINAAEARRREAERERLRNQRDRRVYDDRDDRRDDRRYDDRWYENDNGRNGQPAFCRSGQGHPVFGRDWCRQKGFGLGQDRWQRTRWEDVVFDRRGDRRTDRELDRSTLGDILGRVVLGRFESYGRQYSREPLAGYWVPDNRAHVLMLSVGDFPIARLIDSNRDGRVDNVFLWR